MTAYSILRAVHGYWRWAVLIAAVIVLVRALAGASRGSEWTRGDERSSRLFILAMELQVLMGMVLYFALSPFWPATYRTFGETMSSPVARFFGVEHVVAMALALVVAHAGRMRARKVAGAARHRVMRNFMLIYFALVLWAIPWPWREAGRPLFRPTLAADQ